MQPSRRSRVVAKGTRNRYAGLMSLLLLATVLGAATPGVAQQTGGPSLNETGAPQMPSLGQNGDFDMPAMTIPFSSFASPEAKRAFIDQIVHPVPMPTGRVDIPGPAVDKWRQDFDRQQFLPHLQAFEARYPVNIEHKTIGGVNTDIVTPKDGIGSRNKDRILINLHGGGFVLGGGIQAQAESVPIAGAGKIKVITVDYRMAPENKFPAASEDVAAVYRELLKRYKPENIGIYGCSAGGLLTAQAVAWFQKEKLPRPGAIGILCASAGRFGEGDSAYLWPLATLLPRAGAKSPKIIISYLKGTDPDDPLVSPVTSPEILAKFPPTLILTSTRAVDLSSAVYTDIQLTKAGVDSELHVWDGLLHGGYLNPDVPESQDAIDFIVKFFDRHLGHHPS